MVLYGFGRIGRLLARILIAHAGHGDGLRLRAIVVRKGAVNDLVKRASLLRRDSVHGAFDGTITLDEENNTILANGTSADRQLATFKETGDLRAVVDRLVAETAEGVR